MTEMTTLTKVSEDGKQSYHLVKFSNRYVIFRDSRVRGEEAEFGDRIKEFSNEVKAKKFFGQLK